MTTVSGIIRDTQGNPLSGLAVTVRYTRALVGINGGAAAQNDRSFTTDGDGLLTMPDLIPGHYKISVSVPANGGTTQTVLREGTGTVPTGETAISLEAFLSEPIGVIDSTVLQQAIAAAQDAAQSAIDAADASRLDIGTVDGGATAAATITGDAGSQLLNLVLPTGADGADGVDGQGVAVGGTEGQVLTKVSATDFDTAWVDNDPFLSQPLAQPFGIWDHIPGCPIPDNLGTAKFIRLTAGQSGSGGYNEGLLTDEQVSGSDPLVVADAEIAVGPMAGQRVPLINTEMSFVRPGADSGALQFDQMQKVVGTLGDDTREGNVTYTNINSSSMPSTGALSTDTLSQGGNDGSSGGAGRRYRLKLDTANSPDARVSSTTAGETRPKSRQATYYMRIA